MVSRDSTTGVDRGHRPGCVLRGSVLRGSVQRGSVQRGFELICVYFNISVGLQT